MFAPTHLEPGQVLARDFRVLKALAAGGMGSVYLVEQISTGRQRALKVMHPQLARDAESRGRFQQEARVGARIKSEHVVEVVSAGIDDETGIPWLAMELLDGEELAARMKRLGRLPPDDVLELFRQLCHGLGEAHRAGLVHRDLKPENVFVAASRRQNVPFTVKILDFGVAKLVQEVQGTEGGTRPVGTPRWMAPEQSDPTAHIRPSTDVWALGLIAFHLLTGRNYWRSVEMGGNLTALMRELVFAPIEPASIRFEELGLKAVMPPGFDAWFARCVVREQEHRFPDASAALAALEPMLQQTPFWPGDPASKTDPLYVALAEQAVEKAAAAAATSGDEATLYPDQATPSNVGTRPPGSLGGTGRGMPGGLADAGEEDSVATRQATPVAMRAKTSGSTMPQRASAPPPAAPGGSTARFAQPAPQHTAPIAAPAPVAAPPASRMPMVLAIVFGVVIAIVLVALVLKPAQQQSMPPPAPPSAPVAPAAPVPAPGSVAGLPVTFTLVIDSIPSGADVLDGETKLGSTPLQLSLLNADVRTKPRSFRIQKDGFRPYSMVQGPSAEGVRVVAPLAAEAVAEHPDPKADPKKAVRKDPPKEGDEPGLRLRR